MENLYLYRDTCNKYGSFGVLEFDGTLYETLEPEDAIIPPGTYIVSLTYSPRFRKKLPLVNCVPGHSGVRIHCGNFSRDSQGCILLGLSRCSFSANSSSKSLGVPRSILHSRDALKSFLSSCTFPCYLHIINLSSYTESR